MEENLLVQKSKAFALRIIQLYKYLQGKKELVMSKQLLRSGTSIGANIAEGQYAQSNADFLTKYTIALKEASETRYWLELLIDSGYLPKSKVESSKEKVESVEKSQNPHLLPTPSSLLLPATDSILADANEMVRLLVSATKKLKN